MTTTFPTLSFPLPGQWAQIPVNDDRRVDALAELLADTGLEIQRTVSQLRQVGGDTIFLEIHTETPALLIVSWPARGLPGIESLTARVQAATDAPVTVLERTDGYAALRCEYNSLDGGPRGVTYWISHPTSGRDLMLTVSQLSGDADPERVDAFDGIAQSVTWNEDA